MSEEGYTGPHTELYNWAGMSEIGYTCPHTELSNWTGMHEVGYTLYRSIYRTI